MRDPYHPKAHGLTGEMLDAMLRASFTEGVTTGRTEVLTELGLGSEGALSRLVPKPGEGVPVDEHPG